MWISLTILLVCTSLNLAKEIPVLDDFNKLNFEDILSQFEMFTQKFNRNYKDASETAMRLQVFAESLKKIIEMNKEAGKEIFGINQFADYTQEELDRMQPTVYDDSMYTNCDDSMMDAPTSNRAVPEEVDWRKQGVVTSVKNQGVCGSCWAFGAIGAMEAAHAFKTKKLLSLSEQELVDCDEDADGCQGSSSMSAPFEYVIDHGVASLEAYPYVSGSTEHSGRCKADDTKRAVKISGCVKQPIVSEEALKQRLAEKGPLNIAVAAGEEWFHYSQGVLENCPIDVLDHSVLLVGYGTDEDGVPYWLIKNSWGKLWGEEGYIRIKRNVNACNLTMSSAVQAVA